ncbi:hypothetical protein GGF32_003035 [Allomyces javanicus]|nr:hypothetical protein GGF32_003035 [Allomyces javanicus]
MAPNRSTSASTTASGNAGDLSLATTLFTELDRELQANPRLVGSLRALFCIRVTRRGLRKGEWYLLCRGQTSPPLVSTAMPSVGHERKEKLPVVMIEIDQRDLFNFFSGGLNSYKAITTGRVRVAGDLTVAMALEDVFRKAGGVEKTMQSLRMYEQTRATSKL